MSRIRPVLRVMLVIVVVALLSREVIAPNVRAAPVADPSEVVLVLDFSASILRDETNRDLFAAALDRIADRVDETSADLVAGDATVSIVRFATSAADVPDCTDLRLLDSPETVGQFADCLRSVASAYRKGVDPVLRREIGTDTNYVAAMELAAEHLPADAVRPAMILFTDGKHDVRGVPVSRVQPARDALFGSRSPFALLPVGMGLDPKERAALETGLERLRIIKDMPACVSGAAFDWPQVVFESPDEAGNAVGVALQDATCTFTVATPSPSPTPVPTPTPTPTPAPTLGPVPGIRVAPRDGRIELTWTAATGVAAASAAPITGYRVRCRTGNGDWVESRVGASLERKAVMEGLTNGAVYRCEVAAVGPSGDGPWTAGPTAIPVGRPPTPGKPSIEALNQAVRIGRAPDDPARASRFRYECSGDNGATWPIVVEASPDDATTQIGGLTNGVGYVCRAFAIADIGVSEASALSDAAMPCGSPLECNPLLVPVGAGLGIVLAGSLLLVFLALARVRRRGYVIAVVDVVHTANLGYGSKLGIGFVHAPDSRQVTGVVADPTSKADIRIRNAGGGRFIVNDRLGRRVATDGEPIIAADSVGGRHEVVLRAFNTRAASPVTTRT